jgi:uncharacterized membrane protein YdjX (TVP38/TMEM64 family)
MTFFITPETSKRGQSKILLIASFVASSIIVLYFTPSILSTVSIERAFLDFRDVANEHLCLAVAVFIVGYASLVVLAAFVPSSPISLLGGMLFGPFVGGLAGLTAKTIGAFISFRIWGSIVSVPEKAPGSRIRKISEGIRSDGFWYLLLVRLLPILPFGIVTLAASLARVRLRDFVVATFVGQIPAVFLYAHVGGSAADLLVRKDIPTLSLERSIHDLAVPLSLLTAVGILGLVLRASLNALQGEHGRELNR